MSRNTDKNLFIVPSMPRFYQQLLSGIETYQALGNRIIRQVEAAHAFRQVERVRELSRILINNPVKEYSLIAQYYLAWCDCRELQFDAAGLERIIEQTQTYKTQALFSRGAIDWYTGNNEQAMYFYIEALKTKPTLSQYVDLMRTIAVLKSQEGFHNSALRDLENLEPLIKHVEPRLYYDFLNSYSIELAEAGRKDEARNVIKHVVASPFAFAYPEWQETARELKEPDRSSVEVPSIKSETVEAQSIQPRQASRPHRPRRVIPFQPLKEVPKPNRPNPVTPQEFGDMTADERAELIFAAVKSGAVKESEYVRLVLALGLLGSGPASKVIDLEDEAVLNDIIGIWCNMIEPEEFASVMSALRDCKDDLRRAEIIDNMITIAFRQSPTSMQTEQEWRMRVERRLPEK